mgnify:CR=1 FL=1|tara:strand:- start:1165 stop:2055 length:891 start_codon:yes stop_codon:yes gene_type:complete
MGSVDIIPGISGGTIAFITGIYHELIKSIDRFSFKKLIKGHFRILWEDINGPFLMPLFLGIITGIFFLSWILIYLFKYHPISISAFIFGVIFATFFQFIGLIKNKNIDDYFYLILSLVISTGLSQLTSFDFESNLIYLFFSSVLAVSAMILPGISGAMIFLILGVYNEILFVIQNSLKVLVNFNAQDFINIYSKICSIALGVIFGLKIFSKIVIWFLNNKRRKTLLILTGLIGGSLPTLWPLKNCLNFDILIKHFTSNKSFIICKTHQIVECVLFVLAGVVLILIFNRLKKPIEYV